MNLTHKQENRFFKKVCKATPDQCWIWTGAKDARGYGSLTIDKKSYKAHRVSWAFFNGPIPAGLHLDHLCRRPSCVNPWHLEPVTCRVNFLRGEAPGARALRRDACDFGHPFSEYGVVRSGRRLCGLCQAAYLFTYKRTPRAELGRRKLAGLPVVNMRQALRLFERVQHGRNRFEARRSA
jgi:hypothetical protein